MSDEEVTGFLATCRHLHVATLNSHGAPHLTTVWFTMHRGLIIFETYGTSQKVVNIRRDPRVAVLCEKGEVYNELRGASIKGRAEIVDGEPRLTELMSKLVDHNHPGMPPEQIHAIAARMVKKRVVVVVHPETVITWDHRKLPAVG